jgi:hypothetical protein
MKRPQFPGEQFSWWGLVYNVGTIIGIGLCILFFLSFIISLMVHG